MKSLFPPLLLLIACLGLPKEARGSSVRGAFNNALAQISWGIWSYHDTFQTLPDDIRDDHGKPLLSWRVRLLPFIECDNLYKQFRLNEPWDSPHNRELIPEIPPTYLHAYYYEPPKSGRTHIIAPRGPSTFFGSGKPRRAQDIQNPLAIMLMEADPEHAPIWTKPEDLKYDPANPARGLGRFRAVALADKTVRTIPEATDPDFLRPLFSIERGASVRLELTWHEALGQHPDGDLIVGCFIISLIFIATSLGVICRLLLKKPISPGEMLCLIIGTQQMAFIPAFMACYRYKLLPPLWRGNENQLELWAFPALAGAAGALVAVVWLRTVRVWRILFGLTLAWLTILALDSASRHQFFLARESLATIGHPIFMALLSMVMAVISLYYPVQDGALGRPFRHWAAIAAAMVPLMWFSIWHAYGLVATRDLLVRALE